MDKLDIPDQAQPYVKALRSLIRTGASAAPDLEMTPLIDMRVVRQKSGAHASKTKRGQLFVTILHQVITHRLTGKDAQTALILFAFEHYAGLPMRDRYRAVAELYNKYWTWENYRKEPLTRLLLAIYLALERECELSPPSSLMPAHIRPAISGLVGQDWIAEQYDMLYTLPSRQNPYLESLQTRHLRVDCEGIDFWRQCGYIRDYGKAILPTISLFTPGTAAIIDSHIDSARGLHFYVVEVRFPRPLTYGETIECTILKRMPVNPYQILPVEGWDWYGLYTTKSPVQHATISIKLPPDAQSPRTMWRHEDILSGLIRRGQATTANIVSADNSGYASCSWSNLSAGYSYGIALEY